MPVLGVAAHHGKGVGRSEGRGEGEGTGGGLLCLHRMGEQLLAFR